MTSASVRTKRLTAQTLLLAILILQDFIPALGNIPIGPLSLTTLQNDWRGSHGAKHGNAFGRYLGRDYLA